MRGFSVHFNFYLPKNNTGLLKQIVTHTKTYSEGILGQIFGFPGVKMRLRTLIVLVASVFTLCNCQQTNGESKCNLTALFCLSRGYELNTT